MITGNQRLAKTSANPGKTQLINHYDVVSGKNFKWYLVDLPGYGFAVVSQKQRRNWEQMIENYLRKRTNLRNVFILVDARHSPQKIDIEFINKLGGWKVPFSIVFTKADKNKPAQTERNVNAFMAELQKSWDEPPPFFITSATKKLGKEELLEHINSLHA